MDLAIRQFALKLIDDINNVALPIEVKRLVVKDVYMQIEKIANGIISQSISENNKVKQKIVADTVHKDEETTE